MDSESNSLRRELYFLIAKFLASGPCQRSAKALLEELTHHDLLCERLDWEGNHHPISHQQMVLRNSHIPDDFLLQVCSRLGPLLEKCIPSGVKGITSLLGAGRHSLLRNGSEKDRPTISSLASSHHDCPLLPATSQGLCPNLGQSVISREISGFRSKRQLAQPNTYSKQTMHRRILGHLSAVYCVLFDRTGHCIITGADDSLVKMWSTRDGHLLATLRGHNAEITDIAINYENTLLATGSCDKLIRVWSLKTTYPVAILQGHTGMITSLAFCPSALKESRYLMSTGADGTVCFWKWNENDLSFETTPIRFMEKTRPGSQMVCSSFSPGGSFLVAGSTDHIIRLYQLTPGPPEKIAEVDVHTDHVDSIQFSHNGEKFLSGSKDGTARIWYFKRSKWENILLDISKTLSGTSQADDGNKANKPRVTMVSWDLWDHHVVTAINDHSIKVWNAWTGQLVHILEGHHDELFVLEAHPVDPYVFLSAGHDGLVVLWDLRTGKKITSFFNSIEGQGHGAVFDCKFSPDGLQFACTDSHGHLCIFGYGDSEPFNKVPSEQFFHTDYRPLIRDANNYVLDEQTQTAPHLMPPPFLVDVDGNPHPLLYQQLVPGHGSNIRNAPPTPRADLPPLLAEIEEAENRQRAVIQAPSSPTNQGEGLLPPLQSPGGSRNYGMRQSGDIEGVRQAQGNVPVIEDVAETDIALWRRRLIVPDMKPTTAKYDEERRLFLGKNELTNYLREKKKRPQATAAVRLVNQLIQESLSQGGEGQGHGNQRRTSSRQAARARSRASRVRHVTDRVSSRSAYATRAAVEMVMDESGDDEMIALTTSHSEEEEEWTGSSSDSSEYSDWTEDVGLRSSSSHNENRRSRRVRRVLSTSDEDHEDQEASQSSSPQPDRPKKEKKSKKTTKPKIVPKGPNTDDVQDIIDYYQPSEWITCTKPRVSPYVPQIGDEVYYFPQGHEKYVKEVIRHKLYEINPKKQCYYKLRLKSEELCRIVSLHYSLQNGHPPTLCCIKLAQINAEGLMTGGTFSIKYHDMPDVLDFVILRQLYERAMAKNWREGDRFRSVIDETWWSGIITQYSPLDEEFPDSHFQCLEVLWDTGETERMSPWDLQSVTNDDPGDSDNQAANHDSSGTSTSNIPLTDEDRRSLLYEPTEVDWLEEGRDEMTNRIMSCIESVYQLNMAGPFLYPVDVQTYPDYWSIVCYPTDLTTIIQKLENRFYRRANALIWEIKQIERNARLFNEEESQIVRNSTKFVNVFVQFIRNRECRDILSLCDGDVHEQGEIEVTHLSEAESDANNGDEAGPSDRGKRKRPEKKSSNKRIKREERQQPIEESWITSARNLLQFLMSREDAEPFLAPVNLDEFPDYLDYVQEPMDFTTVSEKLAEGNYSDPDAFVRDVRLVFSNSRAYNTLPRSRIYSMTIRLSAMFEDRVDSILSEWYATASGGARRTRLRTQQLLHNDRPSLYQIVDNSTREDSSQYRVLPQTSSSSDHLRTTIRLPQSRNNRSSDSGSSTGRVPPLRISIPTVAETTTQQVQHHTTTQGTRQRQRTAVHVEHNRNRNAARRSEPLVNGSLTHQYSTRRSRRLQSEESQSGDDDDDDEQEENKSEDDDDDEEDVDDEENEEQDDDDDDSDDESDESEEDSPVNSRISRRSTVRPTMRPTALPRSSRTTSNSKKTRKASSSSASGSTSHNQRKSSSSEGKRISSNTRSRKVTYTESESDSDSEMMNVSSRGRIRRPTQRMLDYVE